MEQIWSNVCTHYDVPEHLAKTWYTRLQMQLSAPNPARAYHNWQEMILRKQSHLQQCKPAIVLAALFQYYHFDGNRSCVQQNCVVFEEFCRETMFEDEEAKTLILTLLGQKCADGELTLCYDDEANLLQDMDLAILASPSVEYQHYTSLLRREYAQLNDESYRQMRLKVLETLLIIPAIYATAEYHEKYESAARTNIKNEIETLKQQQLQQ